MPQVYSSTDTTVKGEDYGMRPNGGSRLYFFLIILFSNIFFLAYWSYKMVGEIRNTLRTNMGELYLYLCLCGNKKRYEDEKINKEIQDENNILNEELERQLNQIKRLWNPDPKIGKLVLNKVNVKKSAFYLHPANYLKNLVSRTELAEEETKEMRRNQRKVQGEKNQFNFGTTLDLSEITENTVGSVATKHRAYRKSYSDHFTEKLDKFLGYHRYDEYMQTMDRKYQTTDIDPQMNKSSYDQSNDDLLNESSYYVNNLYEVPHKGVKFSKYAHLKEESKVEARRETNPQNMKDISVRKFESEIVTVRMPEITSQSDESQECEDFGMTSDSKPFQSTNNMENLLSSLKEIEALSPIKKSKDNNMASLQTFENLESMEEEIKIKHEENQKLSEKIKKDKEIEEESANRAQIVRLRKMEEKMSKKLEDLKNELEENVEDFDDSPLSSSKNDEIECTNLEENKEDNIEAQEESSENKHNLLISK